MNDPFKTYTKSDFPLGKSGYSDHTVFEYHFDSLHHFITYIQKQPINQEIFSDITSKTGTYDFTKTKNFGQAVDLCIYGCDENFNDFFKLKTEVSKTLLKPHEKPIVYKDVVGYAPSVADFVMGSPFNMWNKGSHTFNNIIDIYFQLGYHCEIKTSQIYNRGAITLSLIEALEKFGYAVNLIPFSLSFKYEEVILAYFNLKDTSSFINEKKCFFPLCHPSFHRRLIFRLIEVTPVKESWDWGYGHPEHDLEVIRNFVNADENSIIISTPDKLGISGKNLYDDLESMLKAIDFKKYISRF